MWFSMGQLFGGVISLEVHCGSVGQSIGEKISKYISIMLPCDNHNYAWLNISKGTSC